jgi:hypothetical protein
MGFIVILCLLSSSLDKLTSMYKIPCFSPERKRVAILIGQYFSLENMGFFFFFFSYGDKINFLHFMD